jgi:hypothetical protein
MVLETSVSFMHLMWLIAREDFTESCHCESFRSYIIKMYLNETYSIVHTGKYLSDKISYSEWPETRRCFIIIAFQLCFGICH